MHTRPLMARYVGVNQVEVRGETEQADDQLVVLVSDFPGWRLYMDGQPASLEPVNGYLGARMPAGEHTYSFIFRPTKFYIGLAISLLTIIGMGVVLLFEVFPGVRRRLPSVLPTVAEPTTPPLD